MHSQSFSTTIAGKTITADITDLTAQANGSVVMRMGETVVLVTAVMGSERSSLPFFPLSVEFEEKFYAAGQILGSRFGRREGRPSEEAVLSARLIDRTIRPLFHQALGHSVQIVATVLALGEDDPDVVAVLGSSLALALSDIPWNGPLGAVRIGQNRTTGDVVINPTYSEREPGALTFEVFACGKNGTINMIEALAYEVPEDDIVATLEAASQVHQQLERWQHDIVAAVGSTKRSISYPTTPAVVTTLFSEQYRDDLYRALFSGQSGKAHLHTIKERWLEAVSAFELPAHWSPSNYFETQVDILLHRGVIHDGKRADGRGFDEVRPLYAQAGGISPALHGSGIFYRGSTHILTVLTLAGPDAAQHIDTMETQEGAKRYMHHYNFPPFSVGETGRVGGFNRRMIGHGALAEKALLPVLPDGATFPYTIRLVSETLSSNGSSSMASVCGSSLALMDGGVPITRPVAGIASGVMIDGEQYQLLTDLQGPEDEHGDMDFKVAGTCEGVTALQMDVKVDGVPLHILHAALEQARLARLHILETITSELPAPRPTVSSRAPNILQLKIAPEEIGRVIGSGGKTIKGIKDDTGVDEIDIEDDGTVYISGRAASALAAQTTIAALTRTFTVGELLEVTVTNLTAFGAFAKLNEYTEGLIHVSEIAPFRIEDPATILHPGDVVPVVVSKVEGDKIGLSITQRDPEWAQRQGATPPAS
ncbi:MAG TPA: polyribonucleotide nucleotidyltransferase [Candidatus Paceibacterota bacterium]|nr:polyribonucleotide nucleotidyltransferase [Candidatus Paceibacterota bacterium]